MRYVLSRTRGRNTTFCSYTPLPYDFVRVVGYATHTDHVNDQMVSSSEARDCWRGQVADGFRRDADAEAAGKLIAAERNSIV